MIFDILLLFILVLTFIALGKRIFRLTRTEFSSFMEEIVFSFALGVGVIALLTLGIGLLGGLRRWLFYILIFGLLGVLILDVKDIIIRGSRWARVNRVWIRSFDAALLIILMLNFALALFSALGPQIDWDSLSHHLLVPKLYIQNGSIYNMSPEHGWFVVQSNYPSNMEMLFMVGMLLKSDILANLIACAVSIFLAMSVYSFSRQFLSPRSSLIATIILYCVPIVTIYAAYNTVDIAVALFALLALYAVFKWSHSGDMKFLIFSGVYAGLCAGTKYTGIPVVLVLAVIVFLMVAIERRKPTAGIKYSLLLGVIALAVVAPWYIKNYVYVGNPIYPFLAKVFGGRNLPGAFSGHAVSTPWKGADDYGKWYNLLVSYIRFPWDFTMMRVPFRKFAPIGPAYMLFIPCLIFIRNIPRKVKYLLFYGLLGLSMIFALAQHPRYMFPFVPPLAIVASYSLLRISQWDQLIKRVAFSILIIATVLNMTALVHSAIYRGMPVLGFESRQEHLNKIVFSHEAIIFANEHLPASSRILSTDPRLHYCEIPSVRDKSAIDYKSLQGDEMKLLEEMKRLNITHFLINMEVTAYRRNPAKELYKKLFEQGRFKLVFAVRSKGLAIYELIEGPAEISPDGLDI